MHSETIRHASVLWEYQSSFRESRTTDVIIVCCSYDLRVMDHALDLHQQAIASRLVVSGNTGNWTKLLWDLPEAEIFVDHARNRLAGVDFQVENKATNFGENVVFSKNLVPHARSVTFVTKPNSILRVLLTVKKQWPEVLACVSAPEYPFPNQVSPISGLLGVIAEMVGDIQRILDYPNRGFQVEHDLPPEVLDSWRYLVRRGFTSHLDLHASPDSSPSARLLAAIETDTA